MKAEAARLRPEAFARASSGSFIANSADDREDARAALAALPNDYEDHVEWLKIGMSAFVAGVPFEDWDRWCEQHHSYDRKRTREAWQSFERGGVRDVTGATLFWEVRRRMPGWKKPSQLARAGADSSPMEQRATRRRTDSNHDRHADKEGHSLQRSRLMPLDKLLAPTIRDRLDLETGDLHTAEFPVDALPPVLRGAVEALEEHVQAPRSLCAHSVLSAAALAAQGHRNVRIPAIGSSLLSLYMLAIAESGERKSSCDNVALRAVAAREEFLQAGYEAELKRYKAEKRTYDAEARRIESDKKLDRATRTEKLANLVEPRPPLLPTLRLREPTFEGLQMQMVNGRPSIGLFSSEGGQFLGGHGMSEDARTRTITGLSVLWDSGQTERVRAKEAMILRGRRLSISLAVQPVVAKSLLKDELALRQGFVGRFLITMPESRIGQRIIRESRTGDDPRLLEFERALRRLLDAGLPLREGTQNEIAAPDLHLSAEAWELWRQASQDLETGSGPDGPWRPIQASALKMAENIGRIAGVLSLLEDPHARQVTGEIMASAIAIGGFYLQEALRIVGHGQGLDFEAEAVKALATWLTDVWKGELISPRIMQQRAPNSLRGSAKIMRTRVAALLDAGVLEHVGEGVIDGAKFRECYKVNRP